VNKNNRKRKNARPKNGQKEKQSQPQSTNQSTQRRPRARRFDISSESSLEKLPQLPIQEAVEVENEENTANQQLITELSASIEPIRPTRTHRKPIRFRD